MDRLTRKDLKTDKFALEIEHTVEFLSEHRKQAIRVGAAALIVLVIVLGALYYRRHQHAVRQQALNAALQIQNAPIGQTGNEFLPGYPSEQERRKAAIKAFSDLVSRYPGSDEATIARYYLGTNAADQGNMAEAEKWLKQVADSGNRDYASLAKLALAEIYRGQGRTAEGEKLLRSLVDKPTVFVSREQATLALAELLAPTRPNEARKLLEPLRTERSVISRNSLTMLSQLPSK